MDYWGTQTLSFACPNPRSVWTRLNVPSSQGGTPAKTSCQWRVRRGMEMPHWPTGLATAVFWRMENGWKMENGWFSLGKWDLNGESPTHWSFLGRSCRNLLAYQQNSSGGNFFNHLAKKRRCNGPSLVVMQKEYMAVKQFNLPCSIEKDVHWCPLQRHEMNFSKARSGVILARYCEHINSMWYCTIWNHIHNQNIEQVWVCLGIGHPKIPLFVTKTTISECVVDTARWGLSMCFNEFPCGS